MLLRPAMKTTISLIELMATCLRAAEGAGQIIRRVAEEGKTLQIKDKAAGADATSSTTTNESAVIDPQTKADRMAQYHILSTIKLSFPALRIIGEEDSYDYEEGAKELGSLGLPPSSFSSSAISSSSLLNGAPCRLPPDLESPPLDDVIVWVDPMDGTREFTQGYYDDVTVLIGVAVKGEAVGGVIHHPFVTRMIPLSPSTINTPPLKGSSIWALSGGTAEQSHIFPSSLLATAASRVHRRAFGVSRFRPDETLNEILHSLKAEEIVKIGGAGNKIAAVLHGTVDAYVFLSTTATSKWDIAAGAAILKAAGGQLTDTEGNEYHFYHDSPIVNSKGLIATLDQGLHQEVIKAIKDAKDAKSQL